MTNNRYPYDMVQAQAAVTRAWIFDKRYVWENLSIVRKTRQLHRHITRDVHNLDPQQRGLVWRLLYQQSDLPPRYPVPAIRQGFEWCLSTRINNDRTIRSVVLTHWKQDRF